MKTSWQPKRVRAADKAKPSRRRTEDIDYAQQLSGSMFDRLQETAPADDPGVIRADRRNAVQRWWDHTRAGREAFYNDWLRINAKDLVTQALPHAVEVTADLAGVPLRAMAAADRWADANLRVRDPGAPAPDPVTFAQAYRSVPSPFGNRVRVFRENYLPAREAASGRLDPEGASFTQRVLEDTIGFGALNKLARGAVHALDVATRGSSPGFIDLGASTSRRVGPVVREAEHGAPSNPSAMLEEMRTSTGAPLPVTAVSRTRKPRWTVAAGETREALAKARAAEQVAADRAFAESQAALDRAAAGREFLARKEANLAAGRAKAVEMAKSRDQVLARSEAMWAEAASRNAARAAKQNVDDLAFMARQAELDEARSGLLRAAAAREEALGQSAVQAWLDDAASRYDPSRLLALPAKDTLRVKALRRASEEMTKVAEANALAEQARVAEGQAKLAQTRLGTGAPRIVRTVDRYGNPIELTDYNLGQAAQQTLDLYDPPVLPDWTPEIPSDISFPGPEAFPTVKAAGRAIGDVGKFVARNKWPVAGTAATLGAAGAGVGWGLGTYGRRENQRLAETMDYYTKVADRAATYIADGVSEEDALEIARAELGPTEYSGSSRAGAEGRADESTVNFNKSMDRLHDVGAKNAGNVNVARDVRNDGGVAHWLGKYGSKLVELADTGPGLEASDQQTKVYNMKRAELEKRTVDYLTQLLAESPEQYRAMLDPARDDIYAEAHNRRVDNLVAQGLLTDPGSIAYIRRQSPADFVERGVITPAMLREVEPKYVQDYVSNPTNALPLVVRLARMNAKAGRK